MRRINIDDFAVDANGYVRRANGHDLARARIENPYARLRQNSDGSLCIREEMSEYDKLVAKLLATGVTLRTGGGSND